MRLINLSFCMEIKAKNLLIICLLVACSPPPAKRRPQSRSDARSSFKTSGQSKNLDENNDQKEKKEAKKVDASTLKVFNLVAGRASEKGKRFDFLKYSASGEADYIFWEICPTALPEKPCDDGDSGCDNRCKKNITPYNMLIIPKLYNGDVNISVKACVDKKRSLSRESCGEESFITYNSKFEDTEVRALYNRKQTYLEQLKDLGKDKDTLFSDYKEDMDKCTAHNKAYLKQKKDSMRAVQFINDACDFVVDSAQYADKNFLGGTLTEGARGLKRGFNKATDAMGKMASMMCTQDKVDVSCIEELNADDENKQTEEEKKATCTSKKSADFIGPMCNFAKIFGSQIKGMFFGMSDIRRPIQALSDAFTTIANPENSVARQCLGEQKLMKGLQGLFQAVNTKQSELQSVNDELKAKGEL